VIDNIYCLVVIIAKDVSNTAAVQFKIKLFNVFYQPKQLTDFIYTDIYCKLSKCIGQTSCSYERYLVYSMRLFVTVWHTFRNIFEVVSYRSL